MSTDIPPQQPGLPYFDAVLDAGQSRGKYWPNCIDTLFQAGPFKDARQVLAFAKQCSLAADKAEALTLHPKSGL
ncbi:MAG: hypothetical protein A3F73_07075 [Gallionellales bacterium RIFCSPLOWO2_12_FULL_59_22]|nr:MAG: hypothetical protein A3H99_03975 [Gallionellales bacterium RIFCSPLOWO2_02_FULL_59_110]OGT01278.1 MAG: hypothetical protein A2Z65_07140 [Gallionellales bacterium RIFCSPLOWO2_02_58_13]OGT14157.1 MAG: hypothetical protein A3F73_07075 [Gallionellales bacterium RIFCSPLOWO2_12_FULL_59_22]